MKEDEEAHTAGTPPTSPDGSTARYRWDGETAPGFAIVEAVAETTGKEPAEMPPLQRTIDMDALESLIAEPAESSVRLSFEYVGVDVTIEANGVIEVSQP
jgi:hypothetical protein